MDLFDLDREDSGVGKDDMVDVGTIKRQVAPDAEDPGGGAEVVTDALLRKPAAAVATEPSSAALATGRAVVTSVTPASGSP